MKRPRPVFIDGDIARIPLSRGLEAIVDAADAPLVSGVTWSASRSRNTFYVMRYEFRDGKRVARLLLHRLLLDAPPGLLVDHRDGNGLNCRRNNLRLATSGQNAMNRRARVTSALRLKGVSRLGNGYVASVGKDGARQYLGYFSTPEQAHAAYCEAARILHGEFWRPM